MRVFSLTPIYIGVIMALIDIAMMGSIKMVSLNTLSWNVGVPLAVILYGMEPLIFLKAMSFEGMAVTNLVWNLLSNVIVTLCGVLIFGESIKGLRWLGIAMSLVALTLLAYTDN
jgi:multidrug transporter EmrE-like cation transporter